MSATLDAKELEKYLAPCSILASAGRTFPVEIEYLPTDPAKTVRRCGSWRRMAFRNFVSSRLARAMCLVFMPGGFEIAQTIEAIRSASEAKGYIVLPLHGELPPRDQDARWHAMTGRKWWWRRTWRKRPSRLTACAW